MELVLTVLGIFSFLVIIVLVFIIRSKNKKLESQGFEIQLLTNTNVTKGRRLNIFELENSNYKRLIEKQQDRIFRQLRIIRSINDKYVTYAQYRTLRHKYVTQLEYNTHISNENRRFEKELKGDNNEQA